MPTAKEWGNTAVSSLAAHTACQNVTPRRSNRSCGTAATDLIFVPAAGTSVDSRGLGKQRRLSPRQGDHAYAIPRAASDQFSGHCCLRARANVLRCLCAPQRWPLRGGKGGPVSGLKGSRLMASAPGAIPRRCTQPAAVPSRWATPALVVGPVGLRRASLPRLPSASLWELRLTRPSRSRLHQNP